MNAIKNHAQSTAATAYKTVAQLLTASVAVVRNHITFILALLTTIGLFAIAGIALKPILHNTTSDIAGEIILGTSIVIGAIIVVALQFIGGSLDDDLVDN